MIKIENLTKIYKSRKKMKCKGLDNVSFGLSIFSLVPILFIRKIKQLQIIKVNV